MRALLRWRDGRREIVEVPYPPPPNWVMPVFRAPQLEALPMDEDVTIRGVYKNITFRRTWVATRAALYVEVRE